MSDHDHSHAAHGNGHGNGHDDHSGGGHHGPTSFWTMYQSGAADQTVPPRPEMPNKEEAKKYNAEQLAAVQKSIEEYDKRYAVFVNRYEVIGDYQYKADPQRVRALPGKTQLFTLGP